ncbi:MAG: TetR/AcrR family transcriptional regulator [Deltaproteobacteria bacterium]|nr:TetR/AcrR family transcriptional regulator [Deltaproteobacteria bacterium]
MASRQAGDVPSQEKILEVAESLFARRGYQGVGLREVARTAGLSKSALFHHFPSKLELYRAVLDRILTGIDENLSEPQSSTDGPLHRLLQRIEALIDAFAASPTRAPLLLRSLFEAELAEAPNAEVSARLQKIIGGICSLMSEGIAAGEIRSVPIPHAVQGLIGMLVFQFASGEFGDELLGNAVFSSAEISRHKKYVISLIANGLAASPAIAKGVSRP